LIPNSSSNSNQDYLGSLIPNSSSNSNQDYLGNSIPNSSSNSNQDYLGSSIPNSNSNLNTNSVSNSNSNSNLNSNSSLHENLNSNTISISNSEKSSSNLRFCFYIDKEERKDEIIKALRLEHLNTEKRLHVEKLIEKASDCFHLPGEKRERSRSHKCS